ncbi:hypothetical protein [Treponema brennaborense]|uniref:Uncharacterized protein n=1 Tax=Treponema brennaborense (strain DSM 12168 / CIP 105900 / DD5/3) TaxID=906968 RepID=F4LN50_TREBD|nr:hypothetical protein [Treponema brennaborense]AEE16815.1 hypothetical protein Trebr_1391 [Treponema brennaborense DSM 12168]
MNTDLKIMFNKHASNASGFIKTSDNPAAGLTSEQKAVLNRKGNILFNQGDIEQARRIYLATGYSDGLTRVADVYAAKNRELDALKLYLLAHNKRKSEPLLKKIAGLISVMIEKE